MKRWWAAALMLASATIQAQTLTPTPPMGWNSYDAYGTTITEEAFRKNAAWEAKHLKQFGYNYATIDMEWFTKNPTPSGNGKDQQYTLDQYGRYTPALNRFPSAQNGKGFAPIGAYIHSLGLKFGIHILQGIPKEAVAKKLPIEGTALKAADAANQSAVCRWNPDNYDLKHDEAGQAYYDSIARLYASWGVDLIKVDCIASRSFKGTEIEMLRKALDKTGRKIALSLSPGEPPIEEAKLMQANAQQWRISDDIWDMWHSNQGYPQGLDDQFPRLAKWAVTQGSGGWPDADMLPLGYLGPAPGYGKARQTQLTYAEQRTLMTAWCIFRSPLMMGGDLLHMDDWTQSLLTNPEVLAVDQHATNNHPVLDRDGMIVWTSKAENGDTYVAVFNRRDEKVAVKLEWKEIGLQAAKYRMRDLWARAALPERQDDRLSITMDPHGSALLRMQQK